MVFSLRARGLYKLNARNYSARCSFSAARVVVKCFFIVTILYRVTFVRRAQGKFVLRREFKELCEPARFIVGVVARISGFSRVKSHALIKLLFALFRLLIVTRRINHRSYMYII